MRSAAENRRKMAGRHIALYTEYKEWLQEQEDTATSCGAIDYRKPVVQVQPTSGVEAAAVMLCETKQKYRAFIVSSIERARGVFDDYVDSNKRYYEEEKEIIKAAVWLSAKNPYVNSYESFNMRTMPISRSTFHNYRKKLLDKVADYIGL